MKRTGQKAENGGISSIAWFQKRAFSSLQKISDGEFDYADPLLLYTPGADEGYEKRQQEGDPYHEMVTAPERRYLQQIAEKIIAHLPDTFEYVDLGPGSEHKEQYLFDEIMKQKKRCVYRPIDVSEKFLSMAMEHAENQGITTEPVQSSFEALSTTLEWSNMPRFVSLGLTYSNYEPQEILELLTHIAGSDGYIFVNSQIHERTDLNRLVHMYEKNASVAAAKLELLGLNAETDVEDIQVNDDIEIWCTLKNVTPQLAEIGLRAGDKMLLFRSLRPSMEKYTGDLQKGNFDAVSLFDIGEPFVGALLKNG